MSKSGRKDVLFQLAPLPDVAFSDAPPKVFWSALRYLLIGRRLRPSGPDRFSSVCSVISVFSVLSLLTSGKSSYCDRAQYGLRIKAKLDLNAYPTGIKVTNDEFAAVNLKKDKFHGEWNYTISPKL